ncbi:MAG: hypothetical protein ICV61_00470 [Microcoleus sp. Co-bin12]|nr:hypothetical protein [Microcoleus sp. Co-bin12]
MSNNEIDINATTTDDVTNGGVKLQTEVSVTTKIYLRVEAVRRNVTMGQLIDEMVRTLFFPNVAKSTS